MILDFLKSPLVASVRQWVDLPPKALLDNGFIHIATGLCLGKSRVEAYSKLTITFYKLGYHGLK